MNSFRHFECFPNDHLMPGYRNWLDQLHDKVRSMGIEGESWLDIVVQADDKSISLLDVLTEMSKPTYFRAFYYMLKYDADQYDISANNLNDVVQRQLYFYDLMDYFDIEWSIKAGNGLKMEIHGDHLKPEAFLPARKDMAVSFFLDFNPKSDIADFFELDDHISPDSNILSILPLAYSLTELGVKNFYGNNFPDYLESFARLNLLEMSIDDQVEAISNLIAKGMKEQCSDKTSISMSLQGLPEALLDRSLFRVLNGHDPATVRENLMRSCDAIAQFLDIQEGPSERIKIAMTRALFIHFPDHFKEWCPNLSFDDIWCFGTKSLENSWVATPEDTDDYGLPINPATLVRKSIISDGNSINSRYVFLKLLKLANIPITEDNIKTILSPQFSCPDLVVNQFVDDEDDLIPILRNALIDLIMDHPDEDGKDRVSYVRYTRALFTIGGPDVQVALMEGLAKCKENRAALLHDVKVDLSDPAVKQLVMERIALGDHDNHSDYMRLCGLTYRDFKESGLALPNRFLGKLLEHHISM